MAHLGHETPHNLIPRPVDRGGVRGGVDFEKAMMGSNSGIDRTIFGAIIVK